MTTVSAERGLDGYPVRTRLRGEIIGHVKRIGWRQYEATCATCGFPLRAENRALAGALLGQHNNAEHKPARKVRLLR